MTSQVQRETNKIATDVVAVFGKKMADKCKRR